MDIEEKLKRLPRSPGAYMMKGAGGEILYIGKAKDLRSRVRSYFRLSAGGESGDGRYAVRFLAARTIDIDYIVTSTEKEALILEETLLKTHRPRYNIRLKDDKKSLSIKITMNEAFPRILVTRRPLKDGARYFGPYPSASMARETIKFLRRIFPLCVCSLAEFKNRMRPCLDYQLGICSAPASGLISKEAYSEIVKGAVMFLEGKNRELVAGLKQGMRLASDELDFETAAKLRDRVAAIEATIEEQKVVSHSGRDSDVFAYATEDAKLVIKVLTVRDGTLTGGADFFFTNAHIPIEEVYSSFLAQYYKGDRFLPDEILVPTRPFDAEFLSSWLSERKGFKVTILRPQRGVKLRLLAMAGENAIEALKKRTSAEAESTLTLEALASKLRLSHRPDTIEAFDISNMGGEEAVGAMVAFKNGEPYKEGYRRFKINTVAGQNDFAMIFEVLSRRYAGKKTGEGNLPDMILIDGGKGQLSAAMEALRELGIEGVEIAALAKDSIDEKHGDRKGERVFRPGAKDAMLLREGSRPDLLLRRIRDEVHRFAISYHRKLKRKKLVRSSLEAVPGIGAEKRKALFERFGDLDGIKNATIAELTSVPGITAKLAKNIKDALDVK